MMLKTLLIAGVAGLSLIASTVAHAQTSAVDPSVAAVAAAPVAAPSPETAAVAPPADGTVVAAVPPVAPSVAEQMIPQPLTEIEREISQQLAFQGPTVNPNLMPSLFFTVWEHDLIIDARRGLTTRMPGTDDGVPAAGPRDLALGGIVYRNGKDWTIWLNSLRISPNAIPEEVLDLKVYKDYVELEWFDASTNQIFPIRLRAHQRFNLDTRMFLPG